MEKSEQNDTEPIEVDIVPNTEHVIPQQSQEPQEVQGQGDSESIPSENGKVVDDTDDDNDNETVGNTTFETTYDTGESGDETEEEQNEDITEDITQEIREESDDDSEEEPPKLKYSRLNGLPSNFFNTDPISCCNFHENYFIFATHSGIIHITDPNFTAIRTFKAHRASVLSVYTDGVFFATGSMDGTIVIGSINDEKDIIAYDFKRPIHAVVLDSNYTRTRSFVSGGMSGKVIHSSKNWLGQRSDLVLDEDNGPIVGIHTIDDILIWMNDKGITIFHTTARQVIKVIEKPEDSPRSDLYWPRVHSLEIDRILIGWANYIWCLRFSLRTSDDKQDSASTKSRILPSAATISFRAVQEKKVEIEHVFKLESLIAGIASFKDDYWMILSYEPPINGKFNYPDLKLLNSVNGEVDFEEEIGLKNIENLGLNDFTLSRHIGLETTSYFIVSAKDGVIAQEVQLNDRLEWFLKRNRYKEAWEISQHLLTPIKRLNIGVTYVDDVIKQNDWKGAADFLKVLLYVDESKLPEGDTKSTIVTSISSKTASSSVYDDEYIKEVVSQWDSWCHIFIKSGHIDLLTEIIPVSAKLSLNPGIYTEILLFWMNQDIKTVIRLVNEWDDEIYDVKKIETLMESSLEAEDDVELRKCLVELYVRTFEPQKSVRHLIRLKDRALVKFLSDNHLITNFVNDLPRIIKLQFEDEFDKVPIETLQDQLKDSVKILVDHRHEISANKILKLMGDNRMDIVSYMYLDQLKDIDDFLISSFGNERVRLYSEFSRGKLLPFLMKSSEYDIDYAIKVCETTEFTEELVYLLGKIGENKKALMLIIDKLDNPEVAINFAKHQNDKESWNILLDYSMTKPRFIKALIETADDQSNPFYDPISIFKKIPSDIKIDGLKTTVSKITENNELTYLLNQLILNLIYNSSEHISKKFRSNLLKGVEIDTASESFQKDFFHDFKTILLYNDNVETEAKLKSQRELFPDVKFDESAYEGPESKLKHLQVLTEYLNQIKEKNSMSQEKPVK